MRSLSLAVAVALVISAVACSDTKVETVPGTEPGTHQVQVNGAAAADVKIKSDASGTNIAITPPTATAGQPAAAAVVDAAAAPAPAAAVNAAPAATP